MGDNEPQDRSRDAARLRTLEQLRSRPRSKNDRSKLDAWFIQDNLGYRDSGYRFIQLLQDLTGSNRFIQTWRQDRSEQENRTATGIDPIVEPDAYLDFRASIAKQDDKAFVLTSYAYSDIIFPGQPQEHSIQMGYNGGSLPPANTLNVMAPISLGSHNLTLQEWAGFVSIIVQWRLPKYVAIGSWNYEIFERVFDHRAWPGWMAWFPTRIAPDTLPSFALTFDIGPGTLVATQETNVITTDPAQVERAKEVEIALAQLGVLPTQDELLGY